MKTRINKLIVLWVVLIMLFATATTVFAGGDQNQGEIGTGETHEVCGTQPGCADDEAPKLGPGN